MGRHEINIERAIKVALTSQYKWKLGAVVTNNGRVLSSAPNKFRNPPTIDPNHATTHAEIAALKKCYRLTKNGTIYVARVDGFGRTRMARPCEVCKVNLTLAGIRTIVYTNEHSCGSFTIEKL
jgi:tRNA(Arg) A34 adenosine deaminase TadA